MRNNWSIYILLGILVFACKEQSSKTNLKKDAVHQENKQVEAKISGKTYSDVIQEFKIEKTPFNYNGELLRKYSTTIADEGIITELLNNNVENYNNCISTVNYKENLIFSDTLFYYIANKKEFKVNACKTLKRFILKEKIDVVLTTANINEYEMLICLTLKDKKVKDFKIVSKLVAPDEYNQFGITVSKDFLIKTVNYSYYESSPYMVKRIMKINDDASISIINEMSEELD